MSIDGLITFRGSTCTQRRGTRTTNADKSKSLTWADVTTSLKVLIAPMTADVRQKVWGLEKENLFGGRAKHGADLRQDDVLIVTAGAHTGKRFRVAGVLEHTLGGSRHVELALEEARTEVFA